MKKKNFYKISVLLILMVSVVFTGCKDDDTWEYPYLFRPINFTAELNKTQVTLSWSEIENAESYTLQISKDSLDFSNAIIDTVITNGHQFIQEMEGKITFHARVRANSTDTTKNSKFNQISFKTPAENLFEGYTSEMIAWETIQLNWTAAANVTDIKITDLNNSATVEHLTTEQIANGQLTISNLPKSTYTIEILRNDIVRGTVNVLVEGDVFVPIGGDLIAAITNASAGQVIVLEKGGVFGTGSNTIRFDKNIRIKGESPSILSIVAMTQGTPSTTASMIGFTENSVFDKLSFENIDFTGYCDNLNTNTKIGYFINNNLKFTLSKLSLNNCVLRNFGNTPFRLQGGKNQVIDTLDVKKTTISDIGFTSTYAIVNINTADDVKNIFFENCTFNNFKGSLILRTASSTVVSNLNRVSIINCNIYKGMQDTNSARYLFDFNGALIASGVTIRNSIFGLTGTTSKGANGIRFATNTPLTVSGSYYTSDYVDDPIPVVPDVTTSLKSKMTIYTGTSNSLWTDPTNGDFSILDSGFAGKSSAGDPRWR